MSYISTARIGEQVLVWERTEAGREMVTYPTPYYFYVKSSKGEYTSMFGDKLARFEFASSREFHAAKQEMNSKGIQMFESDIPPELKVLAEHYYNVPAPKLNVCFLDIEVDYSPVIGFSTIDNPYAEINAIAMFHQWLNKYVVFALPPDNANCEVPEVGPAKQDFIDAMNDISPIDPECGLEIRFFENEKALLDAMIIEFDDADVLCGWNSDFFDIPYIAKRMEKYGQAYANKLCFPGSKKIAWREIQRFGQDHWMVDLSGRQRVDYLELFKKYEVAERPSYKLESIADEQLPHLPKLKYDGTLADLFRNDFNMFIRYNIRDTEILKGFEDKLGYVALANEMIHLSTGEFKHVGGTLKLAELAAINYCHNVFNTIVNDMDIPEESGQIKGALVLLPQIGLHQYVGSVDINSLYPSAIRAINISPETIVGQFTGHEADAQCIAKKADNTIILEYEDGNTEEHTAADWKQVLLDNKWAVSGYGTVFDQNKQGTIPQILADWYASRKVFQGKMRDAYKAGDKELAGYYDRLQYVYKIKLNSFYGALTNQYFRFYDLRMGESTTGTGRAILLHQCAKASEILDEKYLLPDRTIQEIDKKTGKTITHIGYHNDSSVVYGDTDSTYFETGADNIEDAVLFADYVGETVNESFPEFMRETFCCTEGYDQHIKTGREIVTGAGIFVDKKRYILHVLDDEGKKVDKIKVMGLDTKKTTMPKEVANKINGFIERFLKGEEWATIAIDIINYKDELADFQKDVMAIGLPKGIRGIEQYTADLAIFGDGQRLPGHVAAGIFYNKCREARDDNESLKIITGMKIKVFYLTRKIGRFKSIALPVDGESVPQWFIDDFVDIIDVDAHLERLVDNPLQNIIKAVGLVSPTKQGQLTDSLLEF
jgi:DNA polymerase elongation subunit (family B)